MAFEALKTVYFVRHGQSEANLGGVFQGPLSPLTGHGQEQARSAAERVQHLSFDALIASPFERAKQTAEAIAHATGKPLEFSPLFTERNKPSRLDDRPHSDPEAAALWKEWNESLYTPGLRIEDGENFDDLIARADAALDYLAKRAEKEMVVVTHGFFLRTLFARVLLADTLTGEAHRNFQLHSETENTGLSVLQYGQMPDGVGWRFWIFNDHAHLAD